MSDEAPSQINFDLIQQLCLEAGRTMEEASPDMALTVPPSAEAARLHVDRLHHAARDIMVLAAAARALVR